MDASPRDYFTENADEETPGFLVVESATIDGETHYRCIEKWETTGSIISYWLPQSALAAKVEAGECQKATRLSEERFRKAVSNANITVDDPVMLA